MKHIQYIYYVYCQMKDS